MKAEWKRMSGWLVWDRDVDYKCTHCGRWHHKVDAPWKYCPDCGCEMTYEDADDTAKREWLARKWGIE